jgi:hypothetical protein
MNAAEPKREVRYVLTDTVTNKKTGKPSIMSVVDATQLNYAYALNRSNLRYKRVDMKGNEL